MIDYDEISVITSDQSTKSCDVSAECQFNVISQCLTSTSWVIAVSSDDGEMMVGGWMRWMGGGGGKTHTANPQMMNEGTEE